VLRVRPILSCLALLLLAGCGRDGGVDRSRYETVYEAAMRAVAAHDLAALTPLLSARGRERLEATLRDFQHRLQDPVQGRRILDLAQEHLGGVAPAEIETAMHGDLEDAWTFLLRADPRSPTPARRADRRLPDGAGVVVEYADPRGTLRTVTLSVQDGVWVVDDLQL
jgi:hypothetical protein